MTSQSKTRLMDRPRAAFTELAYRDHGRPQLTALLRQELAAGLHGLCFSAYLPGQSPDLQSQLGEAQIRERLALIAPATRWVRTFSCTDGNEHAPRIAHELGLKTLVGAWLGADPEKNEAELEGLVALARAGHADLIAVGNEVLYREELSEEELVAAITRVKREVGNIPVGYVDAYYLFAGRPRLVEACDLLMVNCYPFWEYCALEHALGYMQEMYARAVGVAQGKKVLISETGWPSAGAPLGGALPGEEAALRYLLNTLKWTREANIDCFYFSSFDEAWKASHEGDRGVSWGLWDQDGKPKYGG
jgi:exo-beta-1,3-glucanase (GH17 family)